MSNSNLKNDYLNTVIPNLQDEFQYKNKHQIPKLVKITLNTGLRSKRTKPYIFTKSY